MADGHPPALLVAGTSSWAGKSLLATASAGLLVTRTLGSEKQVRRAERRFRADLPQPWCELAGLEVEGYEVHYGSTIPCGGVEAAFVDGSGFVAGPVLGVYPMGYARILPRQSTGRTVPARSINDVLI